MKTYSSQIVVAGGGPAGVCAAIAAARNGAEVLLVEQYGQLGGMSTMGSVLPWMTFHDKSGFQTIRGIAEEIVQNLVKQGRSPGHVADTMGETSTVTPFDPEALKVLLPRMCLDAGVKLLFHTFIFKAECENGRIKALYAANKDGEIKLSADYFIDTSGDADIAAFSGCAFEKGRREDGMMQPVTMNFSMANVDFEKVRVYMKSNPDDFHFNTQFDQLDKLPNCVSGFYSKWNQGQKEMGLDIKRDRVLFFRGYRDDIAAVNTTRVIGIDGTNTEDLTRADIEGREQVMAVAELLNRFVPGFEKAYILSSGAVIGVRETRRIIGRYVLTKEDLVSGRMFDDTIAVNAYTIDVHQPDGAGFTQYNVPAYGISYKALLVNEIDNLIVAGRAISTTREAQGSIRTSPSCMAMGQGAGTAAALALQDTCAFHKLDTAKLKKVLQENNVYLG
jgi:hypothetical protein